VVSSSSLRVKLLRSSCHMVLVNYAVILIAALSNNNYDCLD